MEVEVPCLRIQKFFFFWGYSDMVANVVDDAFVLYISLVDRRL